MSDLWAYVPDVCDGDFCPQDCDHCYKKYEAEEAAWWEEREVELWNELKSYEVNDHDNDQ